MIRSKMSLRIEAPDGGVAWVPISIRDVQMILVHIPKITKAGQWLRTRLESALQFAEGKHPRSRRTVPPLERGEYDPT